MNIPSIGSIFQTPGVIAFAGDWHANADWALQCVKEARFNQATVIVHTGDFGYDYMSNFVINLEGELAKAGILLMFVRGNHDDPEFLDGLEANTEGFKPLTDHIWYIPQATTWTWAAVKFLGLGGAHSVDRPRRREGVSWWARETISTVDMYKALWQRKVDVMITHDCPAGVTIPGLHGPSRWDLRELALSQRHRERLHEVVRGVEPKLLIHGHYHVRYQADLGGCTVIGLDCDGSTLNNNMIFMTLADIKERYCAID